MKKLKGSFEIPILAAVAFAAVLVALGVGYKKGTTNVEYDGNTWCVSNYVEKEPTEYLEDGRPKKSPLLDDRGDWIRKDQVDIGSGANNPEEAAMSLATKEKYFERATKEEMVSALQKGDKDFFTHHYNETATSAGPCWGTGGSEDDGQWINDAIRSECLGDADATSGSNDSTTAYATVKTIQVTLTAYSPCIDSKTIKNTCNCPKSMGGGAETSDGSGKFDISNGRLRWVKSNGSKTEDYVLAQPTSDHIIDWSDREKYAIVIPGFNNDKPIYIRDHYAPGLHANQNYLDLFAPCDGKKMQKGLPTGKKTVKIVDVSKSKASSSDYSSDEAATTSDQPEYLAWIYNLNSFHVQN